ncbi:MAG: hypothetical protein AAF213_07385 [Pseudomonadota bacterium]
MYIASPTSRHDTWQAGSIDGTKRFETDDHCEAFDAWLTDSKHSVADAP